MVVPCFFSKEYRNDFYSPKQRNKKNKEDLLLKMKSTDSIIILALLFPAAGTCKTIAPVHWEFSAKKVGHFTYEVSVTAIIEKPWHIYSQYLEEDNPLQTTIHFMENSKIILNGMSFEVGKLEEKFDETYRVNLLYYSGKVSFVQKVFTKTNKPVSISGYVTYLANTANRHLVTAEEVFEIILN
jgi:thiol:disulfide interchange protein DsbD